MRVMLQWTLMLLGALTAVAAVVATLAAAIVYGPLLVERGSATPDAYLNAVTATRATLVQAILGFAVFIGAGVGYLSLRHSRRAHKQTLVANRVALDDTLRANRDALEQTLAVTRRGQVTDRFTRAIEQLGQRGDEKLDVRIGAVYALEQIAKDSSELHWPIVEVLTAYLREHARRSPPDEQGAGTLGQGADIRLSGGPAPRTPADVQAIATVLGRRGQLEQGRADHYMNLQQVDLRHVQWREAHLEGVRLFLGRLEWGGSKTSPSATCNACRCSAGCSRPHRGVAE